LLNSWAEKRYLRLENGALSKIFNKNAARFVITRQVQSGFLVIKATDERIVSIVVTPSERGRYFQTASLKFDQFA
jgi:hypothetical protein